MAGKLSGSAIQAGTISLDRLSTGASLNTATANITTIVTGNALTLSTGTSSNANIIFSANGVEDMRITPAGDVGIGTTVPLSRLHVQGTDVSFTPLSTFDHMIVENGASGLGSAIQIVAATNGFSEIGFSDTARNRGLISYGHSTDYMAFMTSAVERARINGDGNVGFGTSSVGIQTKIDVFETGSGPTWRSRIVSRNDTGDRASFLGVYNGNAGVFAHSNALNAWHPLYVNTIDANTNLSNSGDVLFGGRIGIGTTSPGELIELYRINTGGDIGIRFHQPGITEFKIGIDDTTDNLYITNNNGPSAIGATEDGIVIQGTNNIGIVRMPRVPSFRAGRSSDYSPGAGADIVFNDTSSGNFHHNNGSHYNTSNGRFTAPVTGRYYFSACVIWGGLSEGQEMDDACYIHVNGTLSTFSLRRAEYVGGITGNVGYYVDHVNSVLSLNAGDFVTIRNQRNLTVHGNSKYTWFSGFLIG